MFGADYGRWVRLIESSARHLTRSTLFATLRHRQKLQNKQLLLQDLVNDSLWLFPMAATIWFASQPEMRSKPGIQELANYFCEEMAGKLAAGSSSAGSRKHGKDTTVYKLTRMIMQGEYAWLEEGIMPLLEEDALTPTRVAATHRAERVL